MKRMAKLAGWTAAILLAAVSAGAVVVLAIDPNRHKDWIASRFQEATGRTLSLEGDVAVGLYPWLGFEVNGAGIGNAEGFGDAPFLYVDHARLRVKLLPLLRGEYEVDTVNVRNAALHLARDAEGISNWDGLVGGDESEAAAAPASPSYLHAVVLGGIAVENARLTWEDRQAGVRYEISELNLATTKFVYGEPIDLNLDFHAASTRPALDAEVRLSGTVSYDADARRIRIRPLNGRARIRGENVPGGETLATLSARVDADPDHEAVSVSDLQIDVLETVVEGRIAVGRVGSPAPSIRASIDMEGADLGAWFEVAEVEPLASRLARTADRDFRIGVTMDADLERGDVTLSDLSARLLGAVVSGEGAVRGAGSDAPGYRGRLNAAGPDLPTLMEVAGRLQGGDDSLLAGYGRRLAGVPAAARAFRLQADFDADLGSGDVSVPALSLDALGIGVTGALQAENMRAGNGTIHGELKAGAAEPSGLLAALGQAGLARTLESAKLEARLQGGRDGITLAPLALQAVFAGDDVPGSSATVTLDAAGASIDPDLETFTLDRFTLHGLGLELAGNADVGWASSPPGFSGRLAVRPFDLRSLAGRLGQKPPSTADEGAFTRVALSGRFSGSTAGLRLRDLDFRLDDTTMTGDFEVARRAGTPPVHAVHAVRFDLHVDEIDLDRYAPPPGGSAKAAGADAPSGSPLAAILGAARHSDVDGSLRIGRLAAAGAVLEALEMRWNARDGVLELAPASARLYGGRLSGDVRLDVHRLETPRIAVRADLEGIDVESFLRDVAGEARVRGKGRLSAALSAAGGNLDLLKRSLNGKVSVELRDGALVGVDLASRLGGWKRFTDGTSVAFDRAEATDFSRLTGNLVANGGIVRLDDLDAETPVLEFTGKGVIADLHDHVIDYRLLVTVADPVAGPGGELLSGLIGIELPIDVEGPLDHPKIGLDWERAIGSLLVPPLLKKIVPALPLPAPNGSGEETDRKSGFDPFGKLLDSIQSQLAP